jgi:hypothetical protein
MNDGYQMIQNNYYSEENDGSSISNSFNGSQGLMFLQAVTSKQLEDTSGGSKRSSATSQQIHELMLGKKRNHENGGEFSNKREVKLEKNRISAQKSRQKKKAYVNSLEEKLSTMEDEIKMYNGMINQNRSMIEGKLENVIIIK